jgi:predicted phosphodiesterase
VRLVLLSDVHGNSVALDAVLAEVERRGGADHYWCLGDLVALGHDPLGVLDRISALPGAAFVKGNTDRYVVTGDRPPPWIDDAVANPQLVAQIAEVAGSFAWTAGCVHASGWTDWLAGLSSEVRMTLPDGTRLLGVHASPGIDDGPGINDRDSDAELAARLAGCDADVVFAGHTHWPVDRTVGTTRAVNLGSLSNPFASDLRASFVIVDADQDGHRIQHVRVDYDHDAVVAALEAQGHPGRPWLIAKQRGHAG